VREAAEAAQATAARYRALRLAAMREARAIPPEHDPWPTPADPDIERAGRKRERERARRLRVRVRDAIDLTAAGTAVGSKRARQLVRTARYLLGRADVIRCELGAGPTRLPGLHVPYAPESPIRGPWFEEGVCRPVASVCR